MKPRIDLSHLQFHSERRDRGPRPANTIVTVLVKGIVVWCGVVHALYTKSKRESTHDGSLQAHCAASAQELANTILRA